MDKQRLIAIVDGILGNDSLCGGCRYGETKGHEEYGSCFNCRRVAADEIIRILKAEDRPTGKWLKVQGRETVYACDQCRCEPYYYENINTIKFCPNCGADMRGDTE